MNTPDPHFPAVHLRPPRNWINDPNGLVFHEGHYHVFFQYNPHSTAHADMHWGHFRSPDLVNWELLPIALAPTPDGEDTAGVWSGNAVSHNGQLVAFYSANRAGRWWQPITSAVSADGGLTFTKHGDLLIAEPPQGSSMFRDPYVWRDGDRWRMLVGAGLADGRGAAHQYVSDDLDNWRYVGPFLAREPEPLSGGGDTEEGWECVQYADLGRSRGVLALSAWDPAGGAARTAAYIGHDQGSAFVAEAPQLLDHGPDFYAPALLHAPDGRWLMWAWAWEARDAARVGADSAWTQEVGWAGMLTIPRELTLNADGSLRQGPAREIDALRGERTTRQHGQVAHGAPHDLGATSRSFDLVLRFPSTGGPVAGGLRLLTATDRSEYLDIWIDPATGDLVADRSQASRDPRAKGGSWRIPRTASPTDSVQVRVIVDGSIAEIFLDTGEALTMRFYPTGTEPWRLQVRAPGTDGVAFNVEAWQLEPLRIRDQIRAEGEHVSRARWSS